MSYQSLRILALPLLRAKPPITHFHYQIKFQKTPQESQSRIQQLTRYAKSKATDTWKGFGEAPPGGWKNRLFLFGEKQIDRLEFEELSLGSFDPPPITDAKVKVPLYYPTSLYPDGKEVLSELRDLVNIRTPMHKTGAWRWGLIAPLTAPFMLVPVIPNIPFFFCVWRCYNHYRAYKSSEFLQQLILENAIAPTPSAPLDKIYLTRIHRSDTELLLTTEDIPALLDSGQITSVIDRKDVERAITQVAGRLSSHRPAEGKVDTSPAKQVKSEKSHNSRT